MNPINLQQETRSPKCDDYYDTTMTKEECQTCYDPFGYMDDAEHMITNAGKVACSGRSYNDHQCRDKFPDIPRTKTSYHLICPDLVECQKEFDYGNECGDLGCCGWLPYDEEKGWVRDQTRGRKYVDDGGQYYEWADTVITNSLGQIQQKCPRTIPCFANQRDIPTPEMIEECAANTEYPYGPCEDACYDPSDAYNGRRYNENHKKLGLIPGSLKGYKCPRVIECRHESNSAAVQQCMQDVANGVDSNVVDEASASATENGDTPNAPAAGITSILDTESLSNLNSNVTFTVFTGTNCDHGGNYTSHGGKTLEECEELCRGETDCVTFASKPGEWCTTYSQCTKQSGSQWGGTFKDKIVTEIAQVELDSNEEPTPVPSAPEVEQNVNCQGYWGDFGNCKNGVKKKNWVITQEKQNDGTPCTDEEGNILTASSTISAACPIDCAGSYDAEWSECVEGKQTKRFNITTSAANGGAECTEASTIEQICAMDCVGSWSAFGSCDVNTGKHSKTYTVTREAINGGAACKDEDGTEVENGQVKTENCKVNCSGEWSSFSTCDPSTGTKKRTYSILHQALNGGEQCPAESGDEETENCPIDCSGNYTSWSECNASTGTKTREYNIEITAKNGGKECENTEDTNMNCKVECVGSWGEFGECDRESLPLPGYQSRTFSVSQAAKNLGGDGEGACAAEDGAVETRACKMNCIGNFSEFGKCDAATGKKSRFYMVEKPALNGGECPYENGYEEKQDCPVDCVGNFGEWGACSEEGKQNRNFVVTKAAMNGGSCENEGKSETQSCPVNCQGSFGDWSLCNPSNGKRTKTFSITRNALNSGAACTDADVKDGEGNLIPLTDGFKFEEPCDIACIGSWSEFGQCDENDVKTKTYTITQQPHNNGEKCKNQNGEELTNGQTITQICPVDCIGSFGQFGQCINGQKQRTYNISKSAKNGGVECPHADGYIEYDGSECPDITKGKACKSNTDCVSGVCGHGSGTPKYLCTNNNNADSLNAVYTMQTSADSCAQNCSGWCNGRKCESDGKTYTHYHCIKAFDGHCFSKDADADYCLKPNSRRTMSGCQCEGECTAGETGHWCYTTDACEAAGPLLDNGKSWDYCSHEAVDAGECNQCIKGYVPEKVEHSLITRSGCECISDCVEGKTGWWCDTKPGCKAGGSDFAPMTYTSNNVTKTWDYCSPKISNCVKGPTGSKTSGQQCSTDSECASGMCADNGRCFHPYEFIGGKIKQQGEKFGKGYFETCAAANADGNNYPGHCMYFK